jgi:hypothetical protein
MWLKLYEFVNNDKLSTSKDDLEAVSAMEAWTDELTIITEDGHKKVSCHRCEGLEHVEVMYQFGQCMLCELEDEEST